MTLQSQRRWWRWWLLPLAVGLLLLGQLPLPGLLWRQLGSRALLRAIFLGPAEVAIEPGRPLIPPLDPAGLTRAERWLQQANGRLDTRRTLGWLALAGDDLPAAQQRLQARLADVPTDRLALYWLGETYLRQGQTEAAVRAWLSAGMVYSRSFRISR